MSKEQFSPSLEKEKKEIPKEFIENATRVLENFLEIKPEENVVLITDKEKESNQEVFELFRQSLRKFQVSEFVATEETKEKEVKELIKNNQVIVLPSDADYDIFDGFFDEIEASNSRMVYMPNLDLDAFKDGGAMTENRQELEQRLERMEARIKDAVGLRIKTNYGTDLTIKLRPFKERRWFKDSGVINQPGQWDNLPGGELFTVPDEEGVNGRLVLPILSEDVTSNQGVDEFVYLNIRNGKMTSIQGGKSAEKLRKYLKEASKEEDNPLSVYQCAEIAFGANPKARSLAKNPDKSYTLSGTAIVEAEKRLGTIHIAFGSTKLGEEGAEGRIESKEHLDFVIPRHGLTVKIFNSEEDFKKNKNARRIIDNGGWNFYS